MRRLKVAWGDLLCPITPRTSWWGKLLSRYWKHRLSKEAQIMKPWRSGGVADRCYVSECFFHINAPGGHRMGFTMTYEEWVHSIEVTKAKQHVPTFLLKAD